MLIYCRGVAVVEHGETGERYEVSPEELEWEGVGGSKRSMGQEIVYGATVDHPELGDLTWSIVEYPTGAENTKETNVGKHPLLEDFDYGLEHEPDEVDADPENLVEWLKDNAEYAKNLTQSSLVSFLVDWFHYYYEDPANETPYNSREGGYQYIYGGPYDAETEIRDNFEGIVSDEVILRAVEEVQSDGTYDWAPSGRHPDQVAVSEEAIADNWQDGEYTFEDLKNVSANAEAPGIGSPEERAKRTEVLDKLIELETSLPAPDQYGGIGHNNPPEEITIADADIPAVRKDLETVKVELTKTTPDVQKVAEKASKLSKIVGWIGGKLDKTVDEFCKAFGSSLGKALGIALPASLVASPYWWKFAELLVSLKDWLLIALGIG